MHRKNDAKNRHLHTIAQLCRAMSSYRQSEKNLLNSNISSTCAHNMANFGPLTAEIGSGVCSTPANFNGFHVLPSLLQRRHSREANQTLQDVWPSPGLVHNTMYIHFLGLLPHDGILSGACKIHLTSNSCVVYILTALLYGTPAGGVSQTLRRCTRNGITELSQTSPPYSAWRPSR